MHVVKVVEKHKQSCLSTGSSRRKAEEFKLSGASSRRRYLHRPGRRDKALNKKHSNAMGGLLFNVASQWNYLAGKKKDTKWL